MTQIYNLAVCHCSFIWFQHATFIACGVHTYICVETVMLLQLLMLIGLLYCLLSTQTHTLVKKLFMMLINLNYSLSNTHTHTHTHMNTHITGRETVPCWCCLTCFIACWTNTPYGACRTHVLLGTVCVWTCTCRRNTCWDWILVLMVFPACVSDRCTTNGRLYTVVRACLTLRFPVSVSGLDPGWWPSYKIGWQLGQTVKQH